MNPTALDILRGTSDCFWQGLRGASVLDKVALTISNIETTMIATEGLDVSSDNPMDRVGATPRHPAESHCWSARCLRTRCGGLDCNQQCNGYAIY